MTRIQTMKTEFFPNTTMTIKLLMTRKRAKGLRLVNKMLRQIKLSRMLIWLIWKQRRHFKAIILLSKK